MGGEILSNAENMFGLNHIIGIILSVIVIVVGSILSIKFLKIKTMHRILLIVAIVSETLKAFTYILMNEEVLGGYLPKTDLPFHLCSIQIIFILILNFSKNEKLKHLLHSFMIPTCLIGGIAAVALATNSARSVPVIALQYYGFHTQIVVFAIYLLGNKEIKFTARDYVNTVIMLAATLFVAIYLNSILYYQEFDSNLYAELTKNAVALGEEPPLVTDAFVYKNINFMYVVNPPADNLPFLNKDHGWLVYIVHYALLAIVCVTLVYIKPIIDFFKERKLKKANKKAD